MYLGLSDPNVLLPETPEDIRRVYDKVMFAEPLDKGMVPDGRLFRRGGVEVIGAGSRALHRGIQPEEKILDAIERMLELTRSEDIPGTYSAIMPHYVFEYIHPFYDGNGRTGRYLLAPFLSRPLSVLTSLSLSRVIAENRGAHYRSFREVEHSLNGGELTFFVMNILEDVQLAQNEVIASLDERRRQLSAIEARVAEVEEKERFSGPESDIVYMLAQLELFASFPDAALGEIADHLKLGKQQTRKYVRELEERDCVFTSSKRPLRLTMSERLRSLLGLG